MSASTSGRPEDPLRASLDDVANQLCQAVDGEFNFLVTSESQDDTVQKLVMLVNFLVDSARRAIELVQEQKAEIERDVALRKRAEKALEDKAKELARSNAELEQFAYVASHDLQEPLRMVSSYMQLLEQRYAGKLGTEADEFIGFAVDGANRMRGLVEALLTYSRLSSRGDPFAPIDSAAAAKRALVTLRSAVEEAGALVTVGPLPPVTADAGQITQLFQCLIGNAIKFRRLDLPRIRISAVRKDDEWQFAVQDNGIGIEREYYEKIFVMFQRLHGRSQYGGTGIGLAICKKIVERHDGRIWVESEPGKGSTFYFTLPVVEDELSSA
jgi:light-regulated signal transduction histidine kinase (bacteriophytochrome)